MPLSLSNWSALLKNITFATIVASLSAGRQLLVIDYWFCITRNPKTRNMIFLASQIALLINGKIEGDANASVSSFGKIEEAKPEQLAFLANPKYEEYLY